MEDKVLGELEFDRYVWWRSMNKSILGKDVVVELLIQDEKKEGILDVQRKAYQTYMENEERYIKEVPRYLLDYYKWNFEEIDKAVELEEDKQKDTIAEDALFRMCKVFFLFICRDGSFGWTLGSSWSDEDFAVLLSESEPRVLQTRDQLRHLHKLNDPVLGLLVHDGDKHWKGLEQHQFYGELENLEIELKGSVEEGISTEQRQAYITYTQKKDELFKAFSKMMLSVYVGSEKKAEEMLKLGIPINVKTILPKKLCIDREGNFGWTCYTEWDKDYVDILLSKDRPYVMDRGDLAGLTSDDVIIDKEMGVFFKDYLGLSSTVIVRLAGEVRTLPFSIDISDGEKEITDVMRKSYREYLKFNETLWEEIKEITLGHYLSYYDEFESQYDVPESMKKENVDKEKVMPMVDFSKLYMTEEGRIAWLCEFPLAQDGLAYEFTDGWIDLITQPEII
ncbi:MAG: hypothetical protein IK131_12775 [Paludibacteraceae bacterium]|nr:hypothetical protein [Paludibacteraceae bacterium]